MRYLFIFSGLILLIFGSCRKNILTTNPADKLSFSSDTLTFDTVFTTLGSDTRWFKVYNTHSKSIKISSLRLANGNASMFRLNVDGTPLKSGEMNDIEIPPHDSMYIFAAVTIDPGNTDNPFVVADSVLFETNGNEQKVILQAYGQNAHFYYGQIVCGENWIDDKPYVIINSILVDTNCTLTIQPGCRVFMHANSRFYVAGTLKVMGMPGDSVVFRGDRLENYFVDLPGNWQGIHFLKFSHDNEINNAVIKEGLVGVRVDSLSVNGNPKLTMRQTKISYTLSAGILGLTASIYAENCLVINSGENNVQLEFGGSQQFVNCTFADYSNVVINHKKAVLRASNFYDAGSVIYLSDLHTNFLNCIIYGGNTEEEMDLDTANSSLAAYDVTFDHCFLKTKTPITSPAFSTCVNLQDPLFADISNDNYHLLSGSPVINAGIAGASVPLVDLDNFPRSGAPEVGCYEFH